MKIVDMYQKVVAVVCQTTGIDEIQCFIVTKRSVLMPDQYL